MLSRCLRTFSILYRNVCTAVLDVLCGPTRQKRTGLPFLIEVEALGLGRTMVSISSRAAAVDEERSGFGLATEGYVPPSVGNL